METQSFVQKIKSYITGSITRSLLVLLICVLIVVNLGILLWQDRFVNSSIEGRTNERITEIANGIEYATEILTVDNLPRLRRMMQNFSASQDINMIAIFDHSGKAIAISDIQFKDKHYAEIFDVEQANLIDTLYKSTLFTPEIVSLFRDENHIESRIILRELSGPLIGPAGTKGVVFVSFNMYRYQQEKMEFTNYTLLFFFLNLLVIGAIIHYLLKNQLYVPINALLDACQESVKTGNFVLPKRLPKNEIGQLANAYHWSMEKLQESKAELDLANEKMQATFRSVQDAIITIDTNGIVLSANQAVLPMFGFYPEELIGQNVSAIMPEPHRSAHDDYMKMYKLTRTRKTIGKSRKLEGRKRSGEIFPVMLKVTAGNANDQPFFTGVIQDLTELVNVEQKLAENQALFETAINASVVGFAIQDQEGYFIEVNPSLPRRVGYKKEELLGMHVCDVLVEEHRPAMKKTLEDLRTGKTKESREPRLFLHKAGKHIWGLMSCSIVRSPDNKKSFIVTYVVDIDKEIELTERLEKRNEELQKSNEDLHQFAYIASHDLKSPLNAIGSIVGWIEEDCGDILPETSKNHFEILKNRCDRMKRLLNDLLSYSRISKLDFTDQTFQLGTLAKDIFDILDNSNKFTLDAEEYELTLPRIPFEIVLRNLLSNAIRHHHKDTGHINVKCQKDHKNYVISVIDDGPGIPPELHEKAMEMFQTLKPRDEVEGSGMGLAIISKILAHFGGSLVIHSDGKNGTEMRIIWPVHWKSIMSQKNNNSNGDSDVEDIDS
ncbi:PAS domain S-box protein [Paraneptunicella aestuarii]|uniref:sensor histidine kinase n=1 Tax=Paraneptunicella aestuarii TaxID=2831148 RepID=UPI001E61B6A0|nr:PAS domain S-box protein [Paraneptunicella aestuarii]UAA38621.1 PAS domain S-box protein [Paraneptunicella aestuarii]